MFLPVMHGKKMWDHTSSEGIPSTVIRWAATFPPVKGKAKVYAGLGVPDINGRLGGYSLYTTRRLSEDERNNKQIINIKIENGQIKTFIKGPGVRNLFGGRSSESELNIRIHPGGSSAEAVIGNRKFMLKKDVWSQWIEAEFDIDLTKKVSGIVKFYLTSVKPEFELFMTSVEINPRDPSFVISYPDSYVTELSEQLGYFHTLGIPEDTRALSEGMIDEDAFISMCDEIVDEQEKMLEYELNRFGEGLLSFVFFTTDRIQHMFWAARDPAHLLYESVYAKKYGHVIEDYYVRMDGILGDVMKYVDNKTAIIVCSDHGFASYRRSVHLNSWLVENGLMVLKKDVDRDEPEGGALFKYVDWSKTRAYALGFSSLYLNVKGREEQGIVRRGSESDYIINQIRKGLLELRDPKDSQKAVKNVYESGAVYSGSQLENSPDLIIGFNEGFRMSWQTAIGGSPHEIFEDNLKKWSGDHIVDPSIVPGILLTNFRLNSNSPGLKDISPTVVSCFGIPSHKMEGRDLI
jgi:predicted AlkP superfamily phosphohydrolase/phosphomutase